MLLGKTREKISTQINDRITAPVRTSVVLSVLAFIIAGIALVVTVAR